MRPFIAFLIVLFNLPLAEAQINLVPNPSFEDTLICPTTLDQIDATLGWVSFRTSPDYFNSCSSIVNVPNATWGYQNAHTGNAFAGLATYRKINSAGPNYREMIGTTLTIPLQVGTTYYCSFFAVKSESNITGFASNNICLRFLNSSFSLTNPAPIDNLSHLRYSSILIDSVNWVKISGAFVADSNYNYVSIGNFYDDLNTDTIFFYSNPDGAYYYIDDVCVSTDSIYNSTWTGLQSNKFKENVFWPNPTFGIVNYKLYENYDKMELLNINGQVLQFSYKNEKEGKINLEQLNDGIYILKITNKNHFINYKLVKL